MAIFVWCNYNFTHFYHSCFFCFWYFYELTDIIQFNILLLLFKYKKYYSQSILDDMLLPAKVITKFHDNVNYLYLASHENSEQTFNICLKAQHCRGILKSQLETTLNNNEIAFNFVTFFLFIAIEILCIFYFYRKLTVRVCSFDKKQCQYHTLVT